MNVYEKLAAIQSKLKAPKNKHNDFSDFQYRSAEDILEAVKPLLLEVGAALLLTDKVKCVQGRYYVIAKAKIVDIVSGQKIMVKAAARETEARPKFDGAQLTGAASSYARKYALNGLFCLDDTQDADTLDNTGGKAAAGAGQKNSAAKSSPKEKAGAQSVGRSSQAAQSNEIFKAGASPGASGGSDRSRGAAGGGSASSGGREGVSGGGVGRGQVINNVQEQLLIKALERKGQKLETVLERFEVAQLAAVLEQDYRVIMAELQKLPDIGNSKKG